MHAILKYILLMLTAALFVGVTTSCVYDDLTEEQDTPQDATMLVINMKLPVMPSTRATDGTYEPGTGYENYIDITAGGFRIYLFDKDNKFLTQFVPMLISPSGGEPSDSYNVVGKVPPEIETLGEFKILVLANWPTYFEGPFTPGVTTIEDLCSNDAAQFNCLTRFDLNLDENRIIPFFGVHHYTGVTFVKGERTTLSEPVSLLRAMAKVEVVFDNPGLSLDDVILHGYNSKGYCAPTGVYSQTDYDHNGQWNEDYVKTLHIPGGANEANAINNATHLLCKNRADGERKETWVCYVPEYKNTLVGGGQAGDRAWLELQLSVPGINLENVYFTDYDENHKSVAGTDFDIHRNNCYRFNVSLGKGGLIISVQRWENTYDNNFIFN